MLTLPPNWDDYPMHNHDGKAFDPNQEEVYIPHQGSATLQADGEEYALRPGVIGGAPGAFSPALWTEIGADPPGAESG